MIVLNLCGGANNQPRNILCARGTERSGFRPPSNNRDIAPRTFFVMVWRSDPLRPVRNLNRCPFSTPRPGHCDAAPVHQPAPRITAISRQSPRSSAMQAANIMRLIVITLLVSIERPSGGAAHAEGPAFHQAPCLAHPSTQRAQMAHLEGVRVAVQREGQKVP